MQTIQKPEKQIDYPRILNETISLAKELGQIALQRRTEGLVVKFKEFDQGPVTNADIEISQLAESRLVETFPAPVVSEEKNDNDQQLKNEFWWLIDPIDGTASYNSGFDGFAVSIALIKNGQAVLGVICAPALDCIYYAADQHGAYKQIISTGETKAISASRFDQNDFRFATFFNPRPGESEKVDQFLTNNNFTSDVIIKSSACLKYCGVAEGNYDMAGGWKPLAIWDIAASVVIVEEAGGRFENFATGDPISFNLNELSVEAAMAFGMYTYVNKI
jgi:3'(2'), 5'-bisphosphate nucleotidase